LHSLYLHIHWFQNKLLLRKIKEDSFGFSKMPLVRLQVRNEFGLGVPELYRDANRDDPKAVLDGVAVAGLVGILRQLGDLAEYVFFSFFFQFEI
jgi:hypothetical protein